MIHECVNCIYYRESNLQKGYGTCRRHAPSPVTNTHLLIAKLLSDIHWKVFDGKDTEFSDGMDLEGRGPDYQNWPIVDEEDGCGEFESATPASKV